MKNINPLAPTIVDIAKNFFMNPKPQKVSSLDIARIFGKRHDNVIRAIRNLKCSSGFYHLNFEESYYMNSQNKKQPMFLLTREGFAILVMGFTGKKASEFKMQYIKTFNEMENKIRENQNLSQNETLINRAREFANQLERRLQSTPSVIDTDRR